MTVNELIAELQKLPGDRQVMVSADEEGNSYEPLRDVELSPVNSDGEPCHPDDADPAGQEVVVIWP